MTRRSALVLAFALLPIALQAGLGPRYGGDLRVGAAGSRPSLDPRSAAGPTARLLLGMVHETLLRHDGAGVRPGLVESWQTQDEGRVWTLALDPRLTFHDGAPLGAADAVRSVRRFLRSESPAAAVLADALEGGAAFRAATSEAVGVDDPDPRHLVLRFRAPVSEWSLLPLASPAAAVISERGAGCGPFVPSVTSGDELRLAAFGAHVAGRPFLDRVTVHLAQDPRRLTADVRLGRLDVALAGGTGVAHAPGVVLLALDSSRPPFLSKDLRLAVAAAIDRGWLAGRMLPEAEPWHRLLSSPAADKVNGKPEAKTRATDGGRPLVLVVDRSLPPLASQRIVAHLDALGFTTTVKAVEPAMVRRTAAEARLLLFEPEIEEPVLAVHELASLFEPAEVPLAALEPDPGARHAMALELEERLRATGTLIPLARLSRSTEIGAHVKGVRADGHTLRLEDAWTALP